MNVETFLYKQSASVGTNKISIPWTLIPPSPSYHLIEVLEVDPMLSWTIFFLVIAIIAGILGFAGVAGAAAGIAKILFFLFLVLFVLSLLFGRRVV